MAQDNPSPKKSSRAVTPRKRERVILMINQRMRSKDICKLAEVSLPTLNAIWDMAADQGLAPPRKGPAPPVSTFKDQFRPIPLPASLRPQITEGLNDLHVVSREIVERQRQRIETLHGMFELLVQSTMIAIKPLAADASDAQRDQQARARDAIMPTSRDSLGGTLTATTGIANLIRSMEKGLVEAMVGIVTTEKKEREEAAASGLTFDDDEKGDAEIDPTQLSMADQEAIMRAILALENAGERKEPPMPPTGPIIEHHPE